MGLLQLRAQASQPRPKPDCLSVSSGYATDQFVLGVPFGHRRPDFVPTGLHVARVRERASSWARQADERPEVTMASHRDLLFPLYIRSSGSVERTYQSSAPGGCTYQSSTPEGCTYQSSAPEGCTHQSSAPEGCTHQSSAPEGCTYQSSAPEGCTHQSSAPEGCTYQSSAPEGCTYPNHARRISAFDDRDDSQLVRRLALLPRGGGRRRIRSDGGCTAAFGCLNPRGDPKW
ncbi:NBS-LRR type resistance protein [Cucumis melo var. makuwa]|uniref:NBS-LRR type resistance protein n=1 Tax=Cucumis melo var. makuwa TaxID=1194695 RepID=A0A5A7TD09_CUCMM|nr:NBS-LRR type resistance protein [Cucumis melo var. makuwa]